MSTEPPNRDAPEPVPASAGTAAARESAEERLLAALRLHVRTEAHRYLDDPNVTSVGIGRKQGGDRAGAHSAAESVGSGEGVRARAGARHRHRAR